MKEAKIRKQPMICGVCVQQPIITQSATVTKITFGGSHHSPPVFSSGEAAAKLVSESGSGDKPSVSDILKISMMEAEIDPCTEPMVVDSSSDCGPLGKALEVRTVSRTLDPGQFISSSGAGVKQFSCVQGLTVQRGKEDLEVIEVSLVTKPCRSGRRLADRRKSFPKYFQIKSINKNRCQLL